MKYGIDEGGVLKVKLGLGLRLGLRSPLLCFHTQNPTFSAQVGRQLSLRLEYMVRTTVCCISISGLQYCATRSEHAVGRRASHRIASQKDGSRSDPEIRSCFHPPAVQQTKTARHPNNKK